MCWLVLGCGFVAAIAAALGPAAEYEIGGALAGLRLPLFPTQHGEPAGYPGCIPELARQGKAIVDMGQSYREWEPQGNAPERQLYDGSVEHWRAYMFKYVPIRSFFDRQSQLKNFAAPNLPGAAPHQVEQYAEPVYWVPRHDPPRPTGRSHKPVPVVRMKAGTPILRLDLGELNEGLYVVRVIGAVETGKLRPFRLPLYVRMTVNDGLDGETSAYRMHVGYCDEFYSVAEFYFHAPARRAYRAEVSVDRGSAVDLLVHNISLDDVLAGVERRAVKTRTTLASAEVAAAARQDVKQKGQKPTVPLSDEDRRQRDAVIWKGFPPVNTQGSEFAVGRSGYGTVSGVRAGGERLTGEQIVEQHGAWLPPARPQDVAWAKVPIEQVFLANPKLQLVYTLDDLHARRPLPDPYPLKDEGAGLFFPDAGDPSTGAAWTPIGNRVHALHREYYQRVGAALQRYKQRGHYDDAHDAALTLVRFAYAFPTLDYSRYLTSTVHERGPFGRDYTCRRRETVAFFLPHYPMYVDPLLYQYDELFDFIRSQRRLAESVGRFVPWVKSPEDVVRLLDMYLVQTTAKRILRYHYHTDPMDIANLATVAGDRRLTDPWMEWLFSRTFIYPLPVGGIQDTMISGTNREGTEFVGSTYYAQGEGASRVAASLDRYLQAGGNPACDLSDQRRYPKPVAHLYWRLENVVGGRDFLRIGDVCGPDKGPGHTLRDWDFARSGWRWTRDPKFAFIIRHHLGRGPETDAEWAAITAAAEKQRRAPWLDNGSRVLPTWAGILEAGVAHDDHRLRRAAYVRVGYGIGHEHQDALDLQVVAHGLPMTIDGGQRRGYTSPTDSASFVHNTVLVDGAPAYRHSWISALADQAGARYLVAEAVPPDGVGLLRRQVALVDVDEQSSPHAPRAGSGRRSVPATSLATLADSAVTVTANSYIFDVCRVGGGRELTYGFHGPLNDDLTWNATNVKAVAPAGSSDAELLAKFRLMPDLNSVGHAPATFEATWRMALDVDGPGLGEREMAGTDFVPGGPRKFTRLHVLGLRNARALRGEVVCRQWNYHFSHVMVRKSLAENSAGDVYAALIEPYSGTPFITERRELTVTGNEPDARRAVAIEVRTRNGHRDVCFADGRPDQSRRIADAGVTVAGEFAYYSTDAGGLRQATLVGGRRLETAELRLVPAAAERTGRVVRADYLSKRLWIDRAWPARRTTGAFEIGVPGHQTTYTALAVAPAEGGSLLTLDRGADYFRSQIAEVNAAAGIVTTSLRPLVEQVDHDRDGWVASDDEQRTFWRAKYLGNRRFQLTGPAVTPAAFGSAGVLRLWECGVGDRVRQSTAVSLRRLPDGDFELTTDVAVKLALRGSKLAVLLGGQSAPAPVVAEPDGWVTVELLSSDTPYRVQVSKVQ
jgi:hypothetical protein